MQICELYAIRYHITFNPSKSKLLCFNVDSSKLSPIYLNGQPITCVDSEKHLGNYIATDIYDRNIMNSVCDFYQRSNSIINGFRVCDNIETLDTLHYTFCMHMYGCELWNVSHGYIEKFKIAWRKVKRRIWNIPYNTHNVLVHNLVGYEQYIGRTSSMLFWKHE